MPYAKRAIQLSYLRDYAHKKRGTTPGYVTSIQRPPRMKKIYPARWLRTHGGVVGRAWAKLGNYLPVNAHTIRPKPADNLCELCHKREAICLDHDHQTGKFRGWLCHNCNRALAVLGDNEAGLLKCLNYLGCLKNG